MNRAFFLSFIMFSITNAVAAQSFTLQQCIDSALAHNIPVKQSGLLAENAAVNWRQSKSNMLPYLSADINHGIYQGRSIDPFSNSYVNQNLSSANYGMNTGVVVFNGGALQNNTRQNAAAYEASKMEWQQARDRLVLDVILAYLQVLNNEDVVVSATRQAEVSQRQLDRLSILNEQGAIKPSDLFDVKGQLMNDQLAIVNARNQLETSKLNLAQLMNRPYSKNIKLDRIDAEEFLTSYASSSDQVYQNALQQFSLVKAVALRKKSSEYAVRSARGFLFPTISLGAGSNTNYSSIAQNAAGKIPYNNQLQNNISTSLGVGVSIPIFNRMQARNRIKIAEIAYRNSELEESNTKLLLRQQIDQAYLNMTNAYERYKVLLEQVNAYTESFNAAEVRYAAGVGTSIDYLTAKDRLDRATINLISARYDFVLRKKVLDFYSSASAPK
ncbi:MAG TPA: TolC family protein [Chitinophagaceae bacterium]|nr:TolC family protein [Chitinophagaceae bacterium]